MSTRLNVSMRMSPLGDVHTVVLEGVLDAASAPLLERTIADSCRADARGIVLDVGAVEFIDSFGLNAILRSRMACEVHGCDFSLTPARPQPERMLHGSGLRDRLPFHRSRASPASREQHSARSGELEIRDQSRGKSHTLVLAGELDGSTSPALERVLQALCKGAGDEIVLDLSQLDHIDSAGARALASSQQSCRDHGYRVSLIPGRHATERLMEAIVHPHQPPAPGRPRPASA